jgi:phosphate-selective porin OprO/OprP
MHCSWQDERTLKKYPHFTGLVALVIWFSWMVPGAIADQSRSRRKSDTVLVRNVTLMNEGDQAEDMVVNILIKDKKLDIVTQDEIPADDVDLALDARQGILVGKLKSGQSPNFIILDGDPRDDMQILLNTATHARFAMEEGVIVRNRLQRTYATGEAPKRSGWLAYSPPPLSIPGAYQDASKWNRWDTRYISGIFTGALAVDRQNWLWQDSGSESQVGDLETFDGGEIRALRFAVVGTLNFPQPWVYTVAAATHAFDKGFDTKVDDGVGLYDLRLDIPTFSETTLSVGKQKEPISIARTMGMVYLPMQERSAMSDAFLPARNIGIVLSGTGLDRRMTWAGGVFNNWLESDETLDESASQAVGRVTWLPFLSEDESNLLHLGLGARYSDAEEGTRYYTTPEFNQSPLFVDTSLLETDSTMTRILVILE